MSNHAHTPPRAPESAVAGDSPLRACLRRYHRRLIVRLAYFGIAFESDLPPEFVVSKHAEERMERRLHFRREKMMKIVLKAWRSRQTSKHLQRSERRVPGREYRMLNGCTFVFAVERARGRRGMTFKRKTLITVILPGEVMNNH